MRCKLTWKLKGTKYKRMFFQLAPSTHRTGGTGFGLLPTVRANQVNGCDLNSENLATRNKGNLEETVAKWVTGLIPTPMSQDGKNSTAPPSQVGRDTLPGMVAAGKTSQQLNPQFVLEMMGFPPDWTELPFLSGETNQSRQPETR